MKAKEYAAKIIEETSAIPGDVVGDERLKCEIDIMLKYVVAVADEIMDRMRQVSKSEAIFSAFREGVTKWKAIVRAVRETMPNHAIDDSALGVFISTKDAELYEKLVAKNVFIGYEFSPSERRTLEELRKNRASKLALTTLFMLGTQINQK